MARRSSIDGLPEETRRWLCRALSEQGFAGYQALEAMLREQGYLISKSAIHRFGQKMERRFAAIKASTEAARLLTEGAADDQDARSEAVIALVQTELFESIMNLQEASEGGIDPAERIDLLSAAAKNIATLTRASVTLKKFQREVREKIAAKMDALEAEAGRAQGKAGFDLETLRRVREEIYGLVG
ncbi:MAG: DUF3486 family protein [Sterolibacterium sp.]|nr:DUF3486 family protein [Sterolibacterium sp.]